MKTGDRKAHRKLLRRIKRVKAQSVLFLLRTVRVRMRHLALEGKPRFLFISPCWICERVADYHTNQLTIFFPWALQSI